MRKPNMPAKLSTYVICLIAMGLGLTLAEPAAAQRSVPVTVVNGEDAAVPVFPAGRLPYQFQYFVQTVSLGEDCDPIPVPEGMVLTITSVGVDAMINVSDTPDVYLQSSRSTGSGFNIHRFRGVLNFVTSSGSSRRYKGIYNLNLLAGPTEGTVSYLARVCLSGAPSGFNSANGIVTGYVEPNVIVDGNSLP